MARPVALVTGASAGIGDAFARLLAARAYDLVVVARDRARLDALAKELSEQHTTNTEVLGADLIDTAQLATVEARLRDPQRPVDLLVNNAGFGTYGSFSELDIDAETRMIELNIRALVRLTHAAIGPMVERGRGSILNVSSLGGFQPTPKIATYGATKAFVTSFSQSVHEEVLGSGVKVSCLCPGFTRTEFQERAHVEATKIPGFVWQTADEVAAAGLAGLEKNRALIVPGAINKFTAGAVGAMPNLLARKSARAVARYYN
jgi:short-subunit dehydrogenase